MTKRDPKVIETLIKRMFEKEGKGAASSRSCPRDVQELEPLQATTPNLYSFR